MGWATKYIYICIMCSIQSWSCEISLSCPIPKTSQPIYGVKSTSLLDLVGCQKINSETTHCVINHMGHGQYLVYSSKSSIFEECIIVFQVLVYIYNYIYISICYRFLKSVLSFSKPQLNFQQIKMSRILLSINLNFGCSSYHKMLFLLLLLLRVDV